MAANLTKERRAECERRAWELRQRGWREQRIADELEVDISTVSRMLARVETRLAKQFEEQAARIKARQTAQLEFIAGEALDEWERSKTVAELDRTVTKTVAQKGVAIGDRDGDGWDEEHEEPAESEFLQETKTEERRGRLGDAALLNQARGALQDIRTIWGLDAPKKTDVTTGGSPFKIYAGFDPDDDGKDEPSAGDRDES